PARGAQACFFRSPSTTGPPRRRKHLGLPLVTPLFPPGHDPLRGSSVRKASVIRPRGLGMPS
ncbi:MAG: hypothetical protein Q9196_007102, partial [Gyalolechia fulgens]